MGVPAARVGRAPWWLILLSGAFISLLGLLVAASLLRPDPPPEFAPGEKVRAVSPGGVVWGRYTVDARHQDRWRFFSFERGELLESPGPTEWDLALRRFRIVVNGGSSLAGFAGAHELGDVQLRGLAQVPDTGYEQTRGGLDGDPRTPALEDWYSYGFVTHLLRPRPTTFALRTADRRYAALRIVSYYCPGAEPGCVTFRYAWRPDGGRDLSGGDSPR